VWIDPGIGFGKTHAHNLTLLAHLDAFVATGYPVLVGTSRKGFLGRLLGDSDRTEAPAPLDDRLEGSLATATWAMACGARMVRVHDVRATAQAALVVGGQITKDAA
jgi:dihydropteroate synthase